MFRMCVARPRVPANECFGSAARLGSFGLFGALLVLADPSIAQNAIERNLPPPVERRAAQITINDGDSRSTDETPLGVDVAGIVLIGTADDTGSPAGAGVTVAGVENAPVEALRGALSRFIGRPLSLALISEIQAAVTDVWRDAGYPFVSVTIPPQEITTGILRLRVIEFRAGNVTVAGVGGSHAERIERSVRVAAGERLNARELSEDLNWLNRVGQRRVAAVFSPGSEFGASDLVLDVSSGRNPAFYAGWTNNGSRATGLDRIFVGTSVWLPELNDLTFTYQLTGSLDLWRDPRRIIPKKGDYPGYVSHSARIALPTWPRQALEISPNFVATREMANAFVAIENTTFEIPVIYRSAVSNIVPGLFAGDVYGGVEFKKLYRTTFFSGTEVGSGEAGVFQLVLGWAHGFDDRFGRTDFDVSIRANPGGVVSGNTDANWAVFSGGRVTDVDYVYARADIARSTRLPHEFSWQSRFFGVLSDQPLPDTERLGLGGLGATRGYTVDDVTVDRGLVFRNELRFPTVSLFGSGAFGMTDSFSGFIFGDLGYGTDLSTGATTTIGSVGIGFDHAIGGHFNATVLAGYALADGGGTNAGDVRVQAQLTGQF